MLLDGQSKATSQQNQERLVRRSAHHGGRLVLGDDQSLRCTARRDAMARKNTHAIALGVALSLAGCVSGGALGPPPRADPSTAAQIVVIRERHFVGGGFTLEIAVDNQPLYVLASGQHAIISVAPGEHLLRASAAAATRWRPSCRCARRRAHCTTSSQLTTCRHASSPSGASRRTGNTSSLPATTSSRRGSGPPTLAWGPGRVNNRVQDASSAGGTFAAE